MAPKGSEPKKGKTKKGKQSKEGISSPAKRKPGTSCHQCRQIRELLVGCKNMPKNKLCSIKLCHKCLLNRYDEKAEEVSLLEDWKCPKCRGICNCSLCMKKQGCQPTGRLVHTTEATGHSSVSDMLQINNVDQVKALKDRSGSWKKINISNNEESTVSSENTSYSKNPSDEQSAGCKRKKVNEKPDHFALIPLPQGTAVTDVGDIDLQPENVGNALQFLEFCMVFGKILDIKKGRPEAVLNEILEGRSSQSGKCSLTIQFLSNLLSSLKEEEEKKSSAETLTEGKHSWYTDIKMLTLKSPRVSRTMGLDSLGNDVKEFENLNPLKKLKILNFICDEVLRTVKIRDWIDDQNSNFAVKAKEAKEKVAAAKDEEKRLNQKMQDEISQAISAKNGDPLSISEHEAIVSLIEREAAEAHASVVESKNTYSKYKQRSEALRTEPFFSGTDDVGTGDTNASDEKRSTFDAEQKEIIEKQINPLRAKRRVRTPKVQQKLPSQDDEATP